MTTLAVPLWVMLLPLLTVFLQYHSDNNDSYFNKIDIPVESLQETYDFIVIGGGSAGKS